MKTASPPADDGALASQATQPYLIRREPTLSLVGTVTLYRQPTLSALCATNSPTAPHTHVSSARCDHRTDPSVWSLYRACKPQGPSKRQQGVRAAISPEQQHAHTTPTELQDPDH
jgi:hypothetical protein